MVERTIVVQGPFEVVEEKEKSGAVVMSQALKIDFGPFTTKSRNLKV